MRFDRISRWVLAVAMVTLSVSAGAATKTYVFSLDAMQEVPLAAVPSSAIGSATVTIDDSLDLITFYGTVFGLDFASVVGGHIHAAPAGVSGPVVFDLAPALDFFGPVSIGALPPVPTSLAFGGVAKPMPVGLASAINAMPSDFYMNLHTAAYPGGEVRGQLAAAVPEPSVYVLMGAGLGLLGFIARRRRERR